MFKRVGYSLIVLIVLGYPLSSILSPGIASADITSCDASMRAHAVSPNSDNNFAIHIDNTSGTDIQWIKLTRPSDNFTIISSDAPGWDNSNTPNVANESNGSLAPGNGVDINLDVRSANVQADPANWVVEATDSSTGQNLLACSGTLDTAITGDVSDITPPAISDVSIDNISTSSVTVSWLTDEASTSQVNYGLDDSYGSSSDFDSTMTTQHTVNLTGLNPGTGYHYQVSSADAAGNPATSQDNTFLTAKQPVVSQNNAINIPITNPGDKTPPTISLTTQLPHVVQSFPSVSGVAADNAAVMRVEYSTDGGANWLPADSQTGIGTKKVTFSFTPLNLEDGNYNILVRAIDGGGNIAKTPATAVVVDKLPPLVGGNVLSLGPQVLQASHDGVISTLAGIDEKITLSAVGGPININLIARNVNNKQEPQSFNLTQSADSGLWSGILSFNAPGTYTLTAEAVDGAGNKTNTVINYAAVAAPASVVDQKTKKPIAANITVYYMQPDSNSWVVWDGAAYGQMNPQTTDKGGNFSLFLPAGQYYLKARAKGYHSLSSTIFKLNQPTPVLTTLNMKPGKDFMVGSINLSGWNFLAQPVELNLNASAKAQDVKSNSLIGQPVPAFDLTNTNNQAVGATDLLGKPTVLTFISTWAPSTNEQLAALSQLQKNPDINVEPVALQQDTGQVRAYNQIAGYSLSWLSDPDSTLSGSFRIPSLPTHYFIDRKGIIRQVVSGVLSKQELLNDLSNL